MASTADCFLTIISLGSNAPGARGVPERTISNTLRVLQRRFGSGFRHSRLYHSAAVGRGLQPTYVNACAAFRSDVAPAALLRFFKSLEATAGRRTRASGRWAPRPLDIDIIDFGGRINNWQRPKSGLRPGRAPTSLILPHPLSHVRAFVLLPLVEVAPHWRHPALGLSAMQLIHALPVADLKSTTPLARQSRACDKSDQS